MTTAAAAPMPTFEPGPGLAFLAPTCLLVVEQREDVRVQPLWDAVCSAEPIDAILAELTRNGVGHAPSFVCVAEAKGATAVLVRGRGRVTARLADGSSVSIDGEPIHTWVEDRVLDVESASCCLAVGGESPTTFRSAIGVLPAVAVSGWVPSRAHVVTVPTPRETPVVVERALVSDWGDEARSAKGESLEIDAVDQLAGSGTAAVEAAQAREGSAAAPATPPVDEVTPLPVSEALAAPLPVVPEPSASDQPMAIDKSTPVPLPTVAAPAAPPASESDFDFDHLLNHTIFFSTEAAAIRDLVDEPTAGQTPTADPAPPPPPSFAPLDNRPVMSIGDPNATLLPVEDGPLRAGHGSLIDRVPGGLGAFSEQHLPSPPPATSAAGTASFDANATLTNAQLRAMLGQSVAPAAEVSTDVPSVPAVRCSNGHLNPPESDTCLGCGVVISNRSITVVPRPSLGKLRFDTGKVVELNRPLLVGRKPPVGERVNGEIAAAVAIPDPDQMLSRLHLEVRLEGWQVLIVDRRSVNATYVTAPGKTQLQVRPGEPYPIVPGTTVSLGDIVSFVYEVERV